MPAAAGHTGRIFRGVRARETVTRSMCMQCRSLSARLQCGRIFSNYILGRRLGRSQPWVSKIETGERRLDVVEFAHLCRELNLQPGRVLARLPLQRR